MQTLSLTQIRRDGGTQTRAMLDLDTVDEYAEQIEAGVKQIEQTTSVPINRPMRSR